MASYCTLQGARRQLEVNNQTVNQDQDANLFFYMLVAAASIDDFTGLWFDDRILTLGFNGNVGQHNPTLYLKELPLVALTTLTNGNGDVVASANYTLLPTGTYPKQQVRLARGYYWRGPNDPSGSSNCYPYGPLADVAYAEDAIQIAGHWVYHRNYARAWKRIGLTLDAAIDEDDTLVMLSAEVGTLFDIGSILRVTTGGSTEQMLVIGSIADSAPGGFASAEITVERGYNNTTAIDHDADDPIDVWQPEPVIVSATEMATAALYKGRDNPTGDAQIVAEFGQMTIPVDLPAKIKKALIPYRSWRRGRAS